MTYTVYVEHPESADRKAADFTAWSFWAKENAPWCGVSVPEMARVLEAVCGRVEGHRACQALDEGGLLQAAEVRQVLGWSENRMGESIREVFSRAVSDELPVRVVFSPGFGSLSASAYLAKAGSD